METICFGDAVVGKLYRLKTSKGLFTEHLTSSVKIGVLIFNTLVLVVSLMETREIPETSPIYWVLVATTQGVGWIGDFSHIKGSLELIPT